MLAEHFNSGASDLTATVQPGCHQNHRGWLRLVAETVTGVWWEPL
jgi:hypothetical protein